MCWKCSSRGQQEWMSTRDYDSIEEHMLNQELIVNSGGKNATKFKRKAVIDIGEFAKAKKKFEKWKKGLQK